MKKLFFPLLLSLFLVISGCGEEKKETKRTSTQTLQDQKDNLYRDLARLKEDIMTGHLEGWQTKVDAFWVHGELIDPQVVDYINEIRRMAILKEKELLDKRRKSEMVVEPQIDENITVTEEIITTYLREVVLGIEAGTLSNWQTYLDKVYLHGDKLTEDHRKIIKEIEDKGWRYDKTRK